MNTIVRFLKPYWGVVALTLICLVAGSIADLMMPNLMSYIVNDGILKQNNAIIFHFGALMIVTAAINMFMRFANSYLSANAATGMCRDIRAALFEKVQTFSSSETSRFGTASLITRSTTDVTQLQNFTLMFLRMGVTAPILAVGGAFMAFSKSAKLAGMLVIAIPFLVLGVLILSRIVMPLTKSMLVKTDGVNLIMREKLTGVRVIRAFGTDEFEGERFDKANRDLTDTALKMSRIMSAMHPIMTIFLNFTSVAVVYMGAVEASYGNIEVGDIMAVFQYISQMLGSVMMISMVFVIWPRTSASAARINDVLDTRTAIIDGDTHAGELHGHISFNNVGFRYPGAERSTLEGISFEAAPGKTTAIIGSTGSGKSTLLGLLLRFYDPTDGSVCLDGVDIRSLNVESYRAKLGYLPQRAVIFSGTAEENIRMGNESATDDDVKEAADIAMAAQFIEAREDGYGSRIEQGGANLSGGQKQRLSIARAVVRRPGIYLFDDSFSALDFKTDAELRRRLADVTGDAAVIIVAQRVSTIMNADSIVVLNEGRVAGVGTHRSLLESCKVYQEIVMSQLSEEEAAGS